MTANAVAALVDARQNSGMSRYYDEALHEVGRRGAANQSLGKADIGALVMWKRIQANTRWASSLNVLPDDEVRRATGQAYAAVNDTAVPIPEAARAGRIALRSLPGCNVGFSLASALLVAMAPARMAVYDRRALVGLTRLGVSYRARDGYGA